MYIYQTVVCRGTEALILPVIRFENAILANLASAYVDRLVGECTIDSVNQMIAFRYFTWGGTRFGK